MSKLSIVIPVYYNSDTLELLYDDLKEKVLGKLEEYEIVFVDDGSGDNSWEIINKIAALDKNVVATKLSRNFGESCTTASSTTTMPLKLSISRTISARFIRLPDGLFGEQTKISFVSGR